MSKEPEISIVLTAHNAAGTIIECLNSIAKNDVSEGLEIILVDDRSRDGTKDAALSTGLKNLRIYRVEKYQNRNLTARQIALDLGIRKSRGKFVFVTNANAIVPSDWIKKMHSVLKEKKVDAVAGQIEFRSRKSWFKFLQTVDAFFYFSMCSFRNRLGLTSGVFFGNFAFRKTAYEKVGGFKGIGFSLTEDLSFSMSMHKLGLPVFFQKSSVVSMSACPDLKALSQRTLRVSASRFSFFSLLIWFWLATLPVLLVPALLGDPILLKIFIIRYGLGVVLILLSNLRIFRFSLLFIAVFYEWIAIVFGGLMMFKHLARHKVYWGGILYDR
jgi:cellulose synthase/poly-beta-1,6-N-acetylglucosamine synthase-like glycosyltransferase